MVFLYQFEFKLYQEVLTKAVDDLAALGKHDEEQAAELVKFASMIEELEDAQKKAKKDKMVAFLMNLNLQNQIQKLQARQGSGKLFQSFRTNGSFFESTL